MRNSYRVALVVTAGILALACASGPTTEGTQGATEAAPAPLPQPEVQAPVPEQQKAPPSMPAWGDPTQVAGAEHGAAAGLTFQRIFELSQAHYNEGQRYPGAIPFGVDTVADAAKRAGVTREVMWDAMQSASEETRAMRDGLAKGTNAISSGVIGSVEVDDVRASDLGPLTVFAKVTVTGCPGRSDLAFLAEEATKTIAGNMPASSSGFKASLWSEGIGCSPSSIGNAVYTTATGSLTLR